MVKERGGQWRRDVIWKMLSFVIVDNETERAGLLPL
jgi:hypothetical protein